MIPLVAKTRSGAMLLAFALLANLAFASAEDWPMRGRNQSRNAVVPDGVSVLRLNNTKNIVWPTEPSWQPPDTSNGAER